MLLKYGVLGLLIERRGYGYELVQRLDDRLGEAWQLNPSAVYTALDQLEQDTLIRRTRRPPREVSASDSSVDVRRRARGSRPGSRRSERVVYEATSRGEEEFQQWLARPSVRVDPIRSEIQLKVALAGPDDVPPLLSSIAQEEWIVRRAHQECLAAAGSRLAATGADPSQLACDTWPSAARALVNAAAARRLEGQLEWIEAVRETLQRLAASRIAAEQGDPAKGRHSSVAGV
jgi:DNA-binding PadR family transcriptional regulator